MTVSLFLGLSPRRVIYIVMLIIMAYFTLNRIYDSDTEAEITENLFAKQAAQGINSELFEGMREMESSLRVFMYDLDGYQDKTGGHPFRLHSQQCGISSGNNKGYGVEWYFVDQIKRSKFFTANPAEANMFLIPVLPCRAKWEMKNPRLSKEVNHERGKAFSQDYVSRAVGHVATAYPYYNGSRPQLTDSEKLGCPLGADHFWFSTHDGGATRGHGAGEDFLANAVALVNTADTTMDYKPCWHVSLPCNCDFNRPPPVSEYPLLFSDKGRKEKVFFAGNLKSNALRKIVYDQVAGDPFFHLVSGRMDDSDYTAALRQSTFCLHLRGFQVWSPRLIEYIWFGCIPVVLGDDYYLPFSSVLDWSQFSVQICEQDAKSIGSILRAISPTQLASMRKRLREVAPLFTFHRTALFGDAFYVTMYEIFLRHRANQARASHPATSANMHFPQLCDKRAERCPSAGVGINQ